LGTSDSSLSDSVVQDEEVTSQFLQPSSGLLYPGETDPPQPLTMTTHSSIDGSYVSSSVAPQSPLSNPCQSPCPSFDSKLSFNSNPAYDPPPIQHSPWSESSLDQPYQKSKKSRSSSTMRVSNPESSFYKERGRTRGPRRRLTEYQITLPEAHSPTMGYSSHASSEDSSSEHSFSIHSNSPCQEFPSHSRRQYQTAFLLASPEGSYGPQGLPPTGFHRNPRSLMSPVLPRPYYNEEMVYPPDMDLARIHVPQQIPCTPNRYDCFYRDAAIPHQRAQRPLPPDIRLTPPPQLDKIHYLSNVHPRHIVNEHLKSWHRRSQFQPPRSRSLDRQGAVRLKNMSAQESACYQNHKYHDQVIQRGAVQRAAEEAPEHWLIDDGSHYMSQV
ncbi:hypothetical protein GOODEAATRI_002346, partial [Goodea atripinnis]